MFASLINLFFRPAECIAPGEHAPVVAPTPPIPRAPRPAVPAVEVAVSEASDGPVIRIKGEARVDCAGALLDGLLAAAARRLAVVTLDLSELRFISSLAMGVLVSYRRGVVRAGGRVRLAEALQPAVKEALARAELFDLFEAAVDTAPALPAVPTLQQESTPLAV
jgi:anti-anti-sigma factor